MFLLNDLAREDLDGIVSYGVARYGLEATRSMCRIRSNVRRCRSDPMG